MTDDLLRRVIAFANNKGGVGKTILTVNLGACMAGGGKKVLVVGLDPQFGENLFADLGGGELSDSGQSLANAMIEGTDVQILKDVRPNLDVIADGRFLEDVLVAAYGRVYTKEWTPNDWFGLLRPTLEKIAPDYDYILLDCPPSSRPLIRTALGAARYLVIPTVTDSASIDALEGTALEFAAAREVNQIRLAGIVIMRSSISASRARAQAKAAIDSLFGGDAPVFDAFTRYSEASTVRSRAEHKLTHEMVDIDNSGPWQTSSMPLAQDYIAIAKNLITVIRKAEENG